jgi:hypothetical protein
LHELHAFRTTLPMSPLSYDGVILKIRWCVRVRVFLTKGREYVAQTRFQLGNLPPAHLIDHPERLGGESPGGGLSGDGLSGDAPPGLEALLNWNAPPAPVVIGPVRMRRVVAGRALSM